MNVIPINRFYKFIIKGGKPIILLRKVQVVFK